MRGGAKVITEVQAQRERATRVATQRLIVERFGEAKVAEAEARLCSNCQGFCHKLGMPLTSEGKDCPYFIERA